LPANFDISVTQRVITVSLLDMKPSKHMSIVYKTLALSNKYTISYVKRLESPICRISLIIIPSICLYVYSVFEKTTRHT